MSLQDGGLWRTAYEVDFTAQSNLNIRTGGNGTKTIDGKVWTWGNDANCTSANVTNGVGVPIVANATATGYYEGANTRTAPNLSIPISSLFSQYSVGQTAVRVLLRSILTNADADAEGVKLAIEDSTTPQGQHFWMAKWWSSGGLKYRVSEGYDPTYTTIYADNATSVSDDIMGLIFWPPNKVESYSGLYSAGRAMKLTTERASWFQRIASPLLYTKAAPRIVLAHVSNNTTNSLTTTFTHLRVDYFSRHPSL